LFAFLHMAVARARRLLYDLDTLHVQRKLALVREAMQFVVLMQQELAQIGLHDMQPPALPTASYLHPAEVEQVQYAAPVQVQLHRCLWCGAPVDSPKQHAASKRWAVRPVRPHSSIG
jgi:hypothetical protein